MGSNSFSSKKIVLFVWIFTIVFIMYYFLSINRLLNEYNLLSEGHFPSYQGSKIVSNLFCIPFFTYCIVSGAVIIYSFCSNLFFLRTILYPLYLLILAFGLTIFFGIKFGAVSLWLLGLIPFAIFSSIPFAFILGLFFDLLYVFHNKKISKVDNSLEKIVEEK